ncbi:hypothetical protein IMZ48_37650 [Candidatus Bathyarchaeota archaeon]|nr:hypothetical protein [Candidatus Bathyarchaeota archaeon]
MSPGARKRLSSESGHEMSAVMGFAVEVGLGAADEVVVEGALGTCGLGGFLTGQKGDLDLRCGLFPAGIEAQS